MLQNRACLQNPYHLDTSPFDLGLHLPGSEEVLDPEWRLSCTSLMFSCQIHRVDESI